MENGTKTNRICTACVVAFLYIVSEFPVQYFSFHKNFLLEHQIKLSSNRRKQLLKHHQMDDEDRSITLLRLLTPHHRKVLRVIRLMVSFCFAVDFSLNCWVIFGVSRMLVSTSNFTSTAKSTFGGQMWLVGHGMYSTC